MIMSNTHSEETFVRGAPLIVNDIGGGAGVLFLLQKIIHLVFMLSTYSNMPFRTPGLEINDSYVHVKYGLKNVGMQSQKLNIICIF